jgi:hypothetical protein
MNRRNGQRRRLTCTSRLPENWFLLRVLQVVTVSKIPNGSAGHGGCSKARRRVIAPLWRGGVTQEEPSGTSKRRDFLSVMALTLVSSSVGGSPFVYKLDARAFLASSPFTTLVCSFVQ